MGTPDGWLIYLFGITGLCALVFGALSATSAKDDEQFESKSDVTRAVHWLTTGTDRPGARLSDDGALLWFFATLSFLGGLTVGAFAAVVA